MVIYYLARGITHARSRKKEKRKEKKKRKKEKRKEGRGMSPLQVLRPIWSFCKRE
jgi:hypothetical protein